MRCGVLRADLVLVKADSAAEAVVSAPTERVTYKRGRKVPKSKNVV